MTDGEEPVAVEREHPVTQYAPGALFAGKTMCIPSRYEGMTGSQITIAMLKADNHVEWFETYDRGRREGEELTWVVTRHDIQAGTSISANVPHRLKIYVDLEDIKQQLRGAAAATADEPKI